MLNLYFMKILHIGDFHFRGGSKYEFDQNLIVNKLIEKAKEYTPIDFIFFTGDLVFSGSNAEDFELAHKFLFEKLCKELSVAINRIIICPGNHDINWDETSEAVLTFFGDKGKDSNKLNDHYNKADRDLKNSFLPSENYYNYFKHHFGSFCIDSNYLQTTYKFNIDGKDIGIVSLNSAWLSSGIRKDKENLLIPTQVVKDSLLKIKDCEVKFVLMHHPLYYLVEDNGGEIEDLLYREFNILFSGHVHKERIEAKYQSSNGIYCNTTQATLTFEPNGYMGFTVLEYDLDGDCEIKLYRGTYLKKENAFMDIDPLYITVPCGEIKHNQNKLRQKITSKFNKELQIANQLLLDYDEQNPNAFIDTFTAPVLSRRSDTEIATKDKQAEVNFGEFINSTSNYIIYGKDKSGKTSLLKRLQLYYLKSFSISGITPLYIDYKECGNRYKKFEIQKVLTNDFEINNNDAINIIDEERLVLLIDNYSPNSQVHEVILSFLNEHPNNRFIICSDSTTSRVIIGDVEELDHEKLYIKDLTRKEIRLYTQKQQNIKHDEHDILLEQIDKLCRQLQLPVNYWTVSLIRLIFKKSNDDYSKNLFSILDLCVDEILNKKGLAISKSSLKFEQYKDICSNIAHFLLIKHAENIYSATYEELIEFLGDYIKNHPRIVGNSKDIFDYLYECGILKIKQNRYTFRLNGIFEYFLSYFLKDNPNFKDDILKEDEIYLKFKNELEIYSGFNRRDHDFVEKIFNKTKTVISPLIQKYLAKGSIDQNLSIKLGELQEFSKNIKALKIRAALDYAAQDSAKDKVSPLETDSEVHLKKDFVLGDILDYETLESYIEILARVFKNSDSIKDQVFVNEIFDFIIESYCILGFYLIDQFEAYAKEKNLKDVTDVPNDFIIGEQLLNTIGKVIPLVSQSSLYSGVGHNNLSKMILTKIDLLLVNKKENQYKLFMLYFLLMDIDVKANKNLVDDIFKNVTSPSLKLATYFKLNFYLAFKAYNNKDLESFLKNKVQESHLRLDNKSDANSFQKPLAKKQKRRLVNESKS
jgi:predicted phosphodiesterase